MGTNNPTADKRFQKFTETVFIKKAFFVLINNSLKMFKRMLDEEQVTVKFFIKEEAEYLETNVYLEEINGKQDAETELEKLLLENVKETVEALDLEALIEGSLDKI